MQTNKTPLYTYIIRQDGIIKKEFKNQESDVNVFGWLLRNQSFSIEWALKYGGWQVEIINEETGEKTKY